MKLLQAILLASAMMASAVQAGIVVIVHPNAGVSSLDKDQLQRIFLGKLKKFPNGEQAIPINQDNGRAARDTFIQDVCNKDSGQYRAYWSQLIFTGKGTPPKDAGDDAAVKALIAKNPNLIGYVDDSVVDASVKVVYHVK